MYAFEYERPGTLAEAAGLCAAGGKPLAGGQTLLASMKLRLASPDRLVDLGAIAQLCGISREGDALVVGAMTRHADVAAHPEVRSLVAALADLAGGIGDPQVRALGTLGGSIANNDPAACYPAAVLGLGATVRTARRAIPADDFFQGLFATALAEDELVTAVSFPIPRRAAYAKFRQPASRFALVGVFVAQFDGGVRVAVTGGAEGVFRHPGLEAALGDDFRPGAAAAVAFDPEAFSGDLHADAAYRAHLAGVLAQRAVAKALG